MHYAKKLKHDHCDRAKVVIKSDKIIAFGVFFLLISQFNSIQRVIDSLLRHSLSFRSLSVICNYFQKLSDNQLDEIIWTFAQIALL